MMELATGINSTFTTTLAYVENKTMRGWPFKIKNDVAAEFESYQGGHMMEAVALAAEQAARHGDHAKGASLALQVAAALHDGFFTADLERTKLNSDRTVVYVPTGASAGRFARYSELHPNFACLDQVSVCCQFKVLSPCP